MTLRLAFTLLAFLAMFALFLPACAAPEPEPKPEEPPPEMYVPPPPPPIDDLLREAREAERVGTETQSLAAVFGLEEALRAYQRIVNHYPDSDAAVEAKDKVKALGERVRELRSWRKRMDEARGALRAASVHVSRLPPLFATIQEMAQTAPEGFIRDAVLELRSKIIIPYLEGAREEVRTAALRAESIRRTGDLKAALAVFQALPQAYLEDLPEIAAQVGECRSDLEKDAAGRAQKDLDRAQSALQRRNERQAVAILRDAWKEFKGFEIAREILEQERRASILELKSVTAEGSGSVRKLDLELVAFLEQGAGLRPDEAKDREALERHLEGLQTFIARFGALVEDMTSTHREFQIRKTFLEKLLRAETERME